MLQPKQLALYSEQCSDGAVQRPVSTLKPHEQLALAQLSALPDDFTIEAAEAVISLSAFPKAPWALDVLQALRDTSLVHTREVGGEMRFSIHTAIRAHAVRR